MKHKITDQIYNQLTKELFDKYNVPQDDETLLADLYYLSGDGEDFFHESRKKRIIEKLGNEEQFNSIINDYKEIEDIVNITKAEIRGN